MNLEAMMVWTWRPELFEIRDTPGGHDGGSLEIHLQAVIVRTWRP